MLSVLGEEGSLRSLEVRNDAAGERDNGVREVEVDEGDVDFSSGLDKTARKS